MSYGQLMSTINQMMFASFGYTVREANGKYDQCSRKVLRCKRMLQSNSDPGKSSSLPTHHRSSVKKTSDSEHFSPHLIIMARSRSRSRERRRRSRSRSGERKPRDRSRDRDRDREDRGKRRYSRERRSSRSRSPYERRRSRSRERRGRDRDDRRSKDSRSPHDRRRRDDRKAQEPISLEQIVNCEQDVTALMGFAGFDTTKNKKVSGNYEGAVKINKPRRYRQYMNRKGGFNRPLDYIA
ncbi:unnamed protein product [Strongylus vulgaris]|uniref:U4/U6.U5 small nuclear ribonucleoprotein 27 kDa protein n=1 Tax=Strongylus vulgaris TaxID=40348 RepID=A0A3P7JN18_STRVU|nr:unnamed protein product [Strongylus vulgaris]